MFSVTYKNGVKVQEPEQIMPYIFVSGKVVNNSNLPVRQVIDSAVDKQPLSVTYNAIRR